MTTLRIGQGYDVHRMEEDRELILGGVKIPYSRGLYGHSDADVLLHALMDALLGAAGMGDIGEMFPDTDPAYEGASSLKLLERVEDRLRKNGYAVVNVDVTLVAQMPKISPYKQQMRANIAAALQVGPDQVNVKATTEERLGFTGNGSGMSATAIALLEKN